MAWLKVVKKVRKEERLKRKVKPSDLIERYKLGKEIHYTDCWHCKLFYRYESCMFRFWLGDRLFCIRQAVKIDSRLRIGLR